MSEKHEHDWQLAFRDGPTDTCDWKCAGCPAYVQKKGQDPPPARDPER